MADPAHAAQEIAQSNKGGKGLVITSPFGLMMVSDYINDVVSKPPTLGKDLATLTVSEAKHFEFCLVQRDVLLLGHIECSFESLWQ